MSESVYPQGKPEYSELRQRLAPKPAAAFKAFSRSVFADSALHRGDGDASQSQLRWRSQCSLAFSSVQATL